MDDTTLIGGADVANICADELVGPQSGQHRGQDNGSAALGPVGAALRCAVGVDCR
jgi:hypothetical protein